jgi:hypothetical protein
VNPVKTKLTNDFIGKYAILKRGFSKGLIGVIQKNETGLGVAEFLHVTKSDMKSGVMFQEDIEVVDIEVD